MVIVEIWCDHSDCSREHRVIKKASDFAQAKRMIDAGQICCPIHGTRADPLVVGRSDGDPGPRSVG